MRYTATLTLLACASCAAVTEGGAPVTAQRPTLSNDPNTAADGTLELELGGDIDPDGDTYVPAALRYGAGPRTEIFASSSVYQALEARGPDPEGAGDLVLGTRHRFYDDGAGTTAAFQFATKLPTASRSEGLGSGEVDFSFAGMVMHMVDERTSLLGFWNVDQIGRTEATGMDTRHGLAFAVARTLEDTGGTALYAELDHVVVPGEDFGDPFFVTAGVQRPVSPSFLLDAGAAIGLNDAAPDLRLLFGFTTNFGRIRGVAE